MIDNNTLASGLIDFWKRLPFPHAVIDGFFEENRAVTLENEFPNYDSPDWFVYENPVEIKKAQNNWNMFPPATYQAFAYLTSHEFTRRLGAILGLRLHPDPGLHGGGWHIHGDGGLLNPHLDYSIHPKYGLQRRVNLIIYLSQTLADRHGGHLGFWSHNAVTGQPNELITEISPKFNRAVIFDTTLNSWHGLSRPLNTSGESVYRRSIAVYYLCEPVLYAPERPRALYAPTDHQKNDLHVRTFIKQRASLQTPQN